LYKFVTIFLLALHCWFLSGAEGIYDFQALGFFFKASLCILDFFPMDTQINKVFFTFFIVMSSDVFIAHGYSNLQCFFSHFYIVMSSDALQGMVLAICVESIESTFFCDKCHSITDGT
jgi:hypothetical protein